MIRIFTFLVLVLGAASGALGQDYLPLWPEGKMPNSKGIVVHDSIANERIHKVGSPGMWVFLPSSQENKQGAVLICPGGGYQRLAYYGAGLQLAKWFNTFGISAFVLKYRLPHSPDLKERAIGPMQDAQRAMRIVRANAARWGINPSKIGIMGTSAGGHLASTLGTHFEDVSAIGDSLDAYPFTPNFMILISPVIDLGKYAHVGSRENLLGPNASKALIEDYSNQLHVTSQTPPAFMVHAINDKTVLLRNSIMFYEALVDSGVSASIHVFPQGAHAIALRDNPGSTELWTTLCELWMKEMGFVAAGAQAVHPASGRVERFENFPSRYVDARTVDVWLPAGYDGRKKFAVLYMHDGRMLFDTAVAKREEWGVDETMGPLMAAGKIRNTIVVGIWTSTMKRHVEYFPQKPFTMLDDSLRRRMIEMDETSPNPPPDVRPISDKYLRFLVTELKPFIDSAYSTLPDKQNTFVAGSSMGGLVSMYAICEYPDVFGGAACFSTHWVGSGWGAGNPLPGAFLRYLNEALPASASHKIYFDHGTLGLDSLYRPYQLQADAIMRAKGYSTANWMTREFPGDEHSERAWKRRFNIPITFLLGR